MSREGRDTTYRTTTRTGKGLAWESTRIKSKEQVDYAEVEIISSDMESEGTIVNSESGFQFVLIEHISSIWRYV